MKSKIINSYIPEVGHNIVKVIALDENHSAILLYNYPKQNIIEIYGNQLLKRIILDKIPSFVSTLEFYTFFLFDNKLALLNFDNIIIWENIIENDNYNVYPITNPFPIDKHVRRRHLIDSCYCKTRNSLFFTIGEYGHGGRAEFFSELKLIEQEEKKKFEWTSSISKLPTQYFKATELSLNNHADTLVIQSIFIRNEKIHFHTNGGGKTGLKNGRCWFEFSQVGVFDLDMNFIAVYNIEEFGSGNYSNNGELFIVHKYKGTNKLLFFETESYSLIEELSITPKQNLGKFNKLTINSCISGEKLRIFNKNFMNVCELDKKMHITSGHKT
ncbi:hypothetical protein ACFSX9_01525 [Flavobacterium ardleyense]|uniref:Uncharacterized protein n=1 Tax=Flavobacterium ardleyense TaxID=2038737 RepID=A0ABW5Z4A2_9FLAO